MVSPAVIAVVTVSVNVFEELMQPFAFFTVRWPVYVPVAVLAGTLILIGLAGKVASVIGERLLEGVASQVIL